MARARDISGNLCRAPFRGSEAVARGLLSRDQLFTGGWLRLFPDVYAHQDLALTYATRCRAVALSMPAGAALSGVSAAYLLGADVLARDEGIEVTVPPHVRLRARPGITVRSAHLGPTDVMGSDSLRLTTPMRTAFDVARLREPFREAVVAVDALVTSCHLTIHQIRDYARDHRGWRGSKRVDRVLALSAEGAESAMESRLRLVIVLDGRLPTPTLQHRVYDDRGRSVARLDLSYVGKQLGIEYDGENHWDRNAIRKDLVRQNALGALGWALLRFTSDDVYGHPARLLDQVGAVLRSGS